MNRREAIDLAIYVAESDLAYTTRWLAQCDDPAYPDAAANRQHFLDWRWDANDRYARALRLMAKLGPAAPVMLPPPKSDLFA